MKQYANNIAIAIMLTVVAFVLFTKTGSDAALSIISACLDTLFETVEKI